jgi:hypothetical protein
VYLPFLKSIVRIHDIQIVQCFTFDSKQRKKKRENEKKKGERRRMVNTKERVVVWALPSFESKTTQQRGQKPTKESP